jgi:hypothetical protein
MAADGVWPSHDRPDSRFLPSPCRLYVLADVASLDDRDLPDHALLQLLVGGKWPVAGGQDATAELARGHVPQADQALLPRS